MDIKSSSKFGYECLAIKRKPRSQQQNFPKLSEKEELQPFFVFMLLRRSLEMKYVKIVKIYN